MRELKFRAWDDSDKEKGAYMLGPYDLNDSIFNYPDIRSLKLMQFTGLKDKNGIDIYEGDVVRPFGDQGSLAQIIFFAPSFKLATKLNNGSYNLWNYYEDEIEIVGNIYQNPELINKL